MYQKLGFNITNLTPSIYKTTRKYCQRKREECKYKEGICFNNNRISPINRAWYYGAEKELYFRYRLFHMGKLDHGIVGADMLFSRLMENYHEQFEKNRLSGDYHNFTNSENKHFSCDQFRIYPMKKIRFCLFYVLQTLWNRQKNLEVGISIAHTDEAKEYLSNVKELSKWCKINIDRSC